MTPEQAVDLCDRHFGVGGDGVIFALPPGTEEADYTMRIFNSDGSEPEMCGNGIRCLARFVAEIDGDKPRRYAVNTLAGLIQPELLADGQVCVDMGEPTLDPQLIPTRLEATEVGCVERRWLAGGMIAAHSVVVEVDRHSLLLPIFLTHTHLPLIG